MKLCLVTRRMPPAQCGIADYTLGLASALSGTHEVVVVSGTQHDVVGAPSARILPIIPDWGPRGMLTLLRVLRELQPDWVLLEYVPFLYSRIGVNVWLPLATCCMRLLGLRVLLTVHEPFVRIDSIKHTVTGLAQRIMIWLLIRGSEKIAVTTRAWAELIAPYSSRRHVFHLPVASNLPCVAVTALDRAQLRAELGIDESDVVVATLRPTGAGKLLDQTMRVWTRLRETHRHARLLVLGLTDAERSRVSGITGVLDVGYVPPDRASRLLSAADVFVALFTDGVSTRRTSVMAAMAHGLPVVTTNGHLTDPIFATSPLVARGPDEAEGLLADLDALARSPQARQERGCASRRFYAQHFDWPVLTGRLNAEIQEPA
ncbi:MAG TPA: glycosyltransferase family 4 protein [Vicinamibacterales bacterium]|nr:glycosyltransferase family 4 protein [Vicinamibacterales bacterium]